MALYRTYRPGSLAEVIGQEHVTEPLARALDSGRMHHAYLLSGPRGCGKTSTARILARSLNCEQGPRSDPCGQCRSCVELAPNGPGSMDVVELDAATHRGIDDARDLREKAIYAPAASRYKVYILDEAHQLTPDAANALLKIVEEPPAHLRFIFATTEPDKIIPTIRSRTFHYGFRLVPARTLAEHLAAVCRSEGVAAEPAALAAVARAGAGSVRDSLSVLGQLLAGAGPEGLTHAEAIAILGLTDTSLIDDFVAALSTGSAAAMFGIVEVVISAGLDPRRFVVDVLDRLRDLIVLRADRDALAKGLVEVPDDVGQRMVTQSQTLGLAELSRAADLVSVGLGEIKGATAPRLQLELLCARLALPSGGEDLTAVLSRLERLERSAGALGSTPGGGPDPKPATRTPSRSASASSGPATPAGEPRSQPSPDAGPSAPPRRPDLRRDRATQPAELARPTQPAGRAGRAVPSGPVEPGAPAAERAESEPSEPRPAESAAPAGQAEPAGAAASLVPEASSAPGTPPGRPRPHQEPTGAPPAAPGSAPGQATRPDSAITRIRDAWPTILERLAGSSRVAWTAFHSATPLTCTDGALAVAVAEPGNVRAIAQRGHDERLRQAILDVLAIDVTVDVLHDPEPVRPGGQPPVAGPSTEPVPAGETAVPATAVGAEAGSSTQSSGSAAPTGAQAVGASRQPSARRPADVVRSAGSAGHADTSDEPSPDDPDLDAAGAHGLALITRELGARPIGQIDHS